MTEIAAPRIRGSPDMCRLSHDRPTNVASSEGWLHIHVGAEIGQNGWLNVDVQKVDYSIASDCTPSDARYVESASTDETKPSARLSDCDTVGAMYMVWLGHAA